MRSAALFLIGVAIGACAYVGILWANDAISSMNQGSEDDD